MTDLILSFVALRYPRTNCLGKPVIKVAKRYIYIDPD